jgi:hypothetical protein
MVCLSFRPVNVLVQLLRDVEASRDTASHLAIQMWVGLQTNLSSYMARIQPPNGVGHQLVRVLYEVLGGWSLAT